MLVDCYKSDFREELLINKYLELITNGVKSNEILVLVQNSTSRQRITENILSKLKSDVFSRINVNSFLSIVYNTLVENWCFIENSISKNKTHILPNLVGLEVSQFLLKDILKGYNVKGYNSKKSLLHQIFRRYSLIVQNSLSNEDVRVRSKILSEAFGEDAEYIIKKLLASTLTNRSLDYLRQILIFNYVYQHTEYFKDIKYLLVDDADEITPACFQFIKYLQPQLKDWLICFDSMGSSRCGYLSADTSIKAKLTNLFHENCETFSEHNTKTFQEENGEIIFENVIDNKKNRLKNVSLISLSKRAEIIDDTILKIKELLSQKVLPSQISIITPLQDEMLEFALKDSLKTCNLVFLSGSEKLIDNYLVKAGINILKLMMNIKISEFDFRVILSDYIGIPLKYCEKIIENYLNTLKLPNIDIDFYNEIYQKFYADFVEIQNNDKSLSQKVYEMFIKTVKYADELKINKFNFFIKQLKDFESVLGIETVKNRADEIINQIENSIIAENPSGSLKIFDNDIVVATPQKIIDNKIATEYQFWLDVSNSEWMKADTGPLYNAWVFQADWQKDSYTIEDDIYLSHQKTARILRKLMLLAENHIYAYSSLYDTVGSENIGGIEPFLNVEAVSDNKISYKITPRQDQKPVLEYKRGTMAISAVPGAGKTTILLALIVKIINSGVKPSNIFVLTYMESAARNFKERIKNMSPNNTQLPNISTIHGLALKIIKENSNFERLNLLPDFEICDDAQRIEILKNIQIKCTKTELEEFDRAISVLKLQEGDINIEITDKKIEKFKAFYQEYQTKLKEKSLIDYDDILLLSVKLLAENKDILEYYQNICQYIIEDEAQDSSYIQQKLIKLLSGKYNNLIRCGDINQAITTTFSNADTEGFRRFIKSADTLVEMNCSQRCTQDVMDLANKVVKWGQNILPNAMYQSMMQGVEGKNPLSENGVVSKIFENLYNEKQYILKEIKNILTKEKDASIGILLRNNYQVASWTGFINSSGLKTITRSESLGQKDVFNTIFTILKFLQKPFDNNRFVETYEILSEQGFYKQRLQLEIQKFNTSAISQNTDDINSHGLSQFVWDMQYWLNSSGMSLEELVIKIGSYYYTSNLEKSNVYLIAMLIKKISVNSDFDTVIEKLDALSKKPSLSGFKFFAQEDDNSVLKGKVQIMTLHKSKGDEFDYVFIPELTEKSLSVDVNNISVKSATLFMEQVRKFNPKYKIKTEQELKEFSAEESMRLLYVGITRAKKRLYLTVSSKAKSFNKEVPQTPSIIFSILE